MNKRISMPLRFILGGYLTFTGAKLLLDMIRVKPTDMALKAAFAVLFIAFGVWYLIQCGKEAYHNHKEKQEEKKEEQIMIEEAEKEKEHRKLHSNTKFRTAPMDVDEIKQAEEESVTISLKEDAEPFSGSGTKKTANKSSVVSLDLNDSDSDEENDYEEN